MYPWTKVVTEMLPQGSTHHVGVTSCGNCYFFWEWKCCWWKKSGVHHLRLVVLLPLFTTGFLHPRWLAGFPNHQQYHCTSLSRPQMDRNPCSSDLLDAIKMIKWENSIIRTGYAYSSLPLYVCKGCCSTFMIFILSLSSWWFQPIWKILVKLDHFPK